MTKTNQMVQQIPLKDLAPSTENSRKTHTKEGAESLARSVAALGIIVPFVVRKTADGLQVVDGHRRLIAAKAAGLEVVPCIVKDLSDSEVDLERLTVNAEREAVPPIEEAEAMERLVQRLGGDLKEAAAQLGKSPAHVAGRLDLLKLSPKVREAVKSGELPLSWAMEFRRVSDHTAQDELLNRCIGDEYRAPESVQELRQLVEKEFSLNLARAPFDLDDANLCPAAGSCKACPKRTGAQVGLFEGLGKDAPEICRDRACYESKVKAHVAKRIEEGKKGTATVLTGAAAEKALDGADRNWGEAKFMDIDLDRNGVKARKAFAAAVKEDPGLLKKMVTAVDKNGRAVELYPRKDLEEMVEKYRRQQQAEQPRKRKSEAEKKAEAKHQAEARARKKKEHLEDLARSVAAEILAEQLVSKGLLKGGLLLALASVASELMVGDGDEALLRSCGMHKPGATYMVKAKLMDELVKDPKHAAKAVAYGLAWAGGPLPQVWSRMELAGVDRARAEKGAREWADREEALGTAKAKVDAAAAGKPTAILSLLEREVLKADGWTHRGDDTRPENWTAPAAKDKKGKSKKKGKK